MERILLGAGTGKNTVQANIKGILVDRKIGCQETLRFYISGSDDKISLVFYCVSENIERMKTTVSNKNRFRARVRNVSVNEIGKSVELIFLADRLYNTVSVPFRKQVKRGNNMNLIVTFRRFSIGREKRILITLIPSRLNNN